MCFRSALVAWNLSLENMCVCVCVFVCIVCVCVCVCVCVSVLSISTDGLESET